MFKFVRDRRTGSHQRHLSAQHIEKLRKFIQARFANKFPNARHAWIAFDFVGSGAVCTSINHTALYKLHNRSAVMYVIIVYIHRAKLEKLKFDTMLANAFLTKKDRAWRVQPNENGNDCHDQTEQRQEKQGECNIHYTFVTQIIGF